MNRSIWVLRYVLVVLFIGKLNLEMFAEVTGLSSTRQFDSRARGHRSRQSCQCQ